MMDCPLCGKSAANARTRLIKDTCGHMKCRLCLLQEESGCTMCFAQTLEHSETSVAAISSNDFPQPNASMPTLINIPSPTKLPANEIYEYFVNPFGMSNVINNELSESDFEKIVTENDSEEDRRKNQYYEGNKGESNDETVSNCLSSLKSTESSSINSNTKSNFSNNLSVEKGPIINNIISKDTSQKNKEIQNEQNKENSKEQTEILENTVINTNKEIAFNQDDFTVLVLINDKSHTRNDNQSTVQITEITENGNEDGNLSHETPDQLCENTVQIIEINENRNKDANLPHKMPNELCESTIQIIEINENRNEDDNLSHETPNQVYKSTAQIIEINANRNENDGLSQKMLNQLIMYKSPEFRMSDYLIFNRRENIDFSKYIASPVQSLGSRSPEFRLSDYLSFKKYGGNVYPQLIASPVPTFGSSSPEFRLSDCIVLHKSGDRVNDNSQLILSPAHSTGYRTPEFRLSDYLILNSQGMNKTYARLIESPAADKVLDYTAQSIESNKNKTGDSDNDDEDKENIDDSIRDEEATFPKKETDASDVIKADMNDKKRKRIKSNPETKSKRAKKSNGASNVRKSSRKRKLKAEKDKIVNEKVKKEPVVERRKVNKDWSHIVKLPGSSNLYECLKCKKSFSTLRNKSYHVVCLLGESPFCCDICGKTFKKRSHFEYHQITHTGNKPFKCQDCQKAFATKNKLDRHMLSHKPQNEFECDECGRKLSTKDNLKCHLARHRNPSFKCKHCPKTFTVKANRNRHEQYCFPTSQQVNTATNQRYPCDSCSKVFQKDYLLYQHKWRLHRKGKSYSCHVCQRVFLRKSELDRHATIHSDVKKFNCELCDVEFSRRDNLKRHEKNHHSGPYEGNSGNVTPIAAKEYVAEASPKSSPRGRKRSAVNSPNPKQRKTPKKDSPSKLKSASNDVSIGTQVTRGPINIKCFAGYSDSPTKKLTEPLSFEAALELNQQIERKMHDQKTFCNFPGLAYVISSPSSSSSKRRESSVSNSNSNDGMSPAHDESQDRLKAKSIKIKEEFSMQHWRRRTAECLKLKRNS